MAAQAGIGYRGATSPSVYLIAIALAMVLGAAIVALGDTALFGLVGLFAFAIFLRYPVLGVFVTTVLLLLVSGAAGVLGSLEAVVPVTYAKMSGFVTLAAWLINTVTRRQPILIRVHEGLLLAFFVWAFFGVAASPHASSQFTEWVRLATLVTFYIIATHLLADREMLRRYVITLAWCGLIMSVFAVAQYFIPALHFTPEQLREIGRGAAQGGAYVDPESLHTGAAVRVSGTSGHSNWLAFTLLLLVPLNVYWYYSAKSKRVRLLAIMATVLEVTALVLTFTRTGFIVGVAVLFLLISRGLIKINPNRVVALAVAALMMWFVLPSAYKERVLNIDSYAGSSSVQHRAQLMGEALKMSVSNPMLGVGVGGYGHHLIEEDTEAAVISRWLVDEYDWNPAFLGAHNMYLHVASETGIIGIGLLMLFVYVVMRRLRFAERTFKKRGDQEMYVLALALTVSLFSFLLCGLFLHALQQKVWWMVAAAAAVAPTVAVRGASQEAGAKDA